MTDKQIKLDGSWIPIEEAIKARLISEKDIDVLSNRPDWRITLQADHIKRLEEELKAKEQECERLKKEVEFYTTPVKLGDYKPITLIIEELDQLKAEVKSKTEYIQEQRDIINQYSKEIEMYKKCQGKRASKREEELKAENVELKNRVAELSLFQLYKIQRDEAEQTLTEIKEIAEHCINQDICTFCDNSDKCYIEDEEIPTYDVCKLILQKISEVVDEN